MIMLDGPNREGGSGHASAPQSQNSQVDSVPIIQQEEVIEETIKVEDIPF